MKTKATLVSLLMHLNLFAQVPLDANTKVIKVRRSSDCFGIELSNLNVMYLNSDNEFRVNYGGKAKLKVVLSNGTATDMGDGKFIAKIKEGSETVLSVYEIKGKTENAIGTRVYRLKSVPKPIAMVGGKESGNTISKNLLLSANGISIALLGFLYDVQYEVISYNASINIAGEFKTVQTYGPVYNLEMRALISKLKNRSRVIFEDIRVRIIGSSQIITIAPITLRISG